MFREQFITAMSAIIIFIEIDCSANITNYQIDTYLSMLLRLFTVELIEFLREILLLMFLPQFGQYSLSQSRISPQLQTIRVLILRLGFKGLSQCSQNLK